MGQKSRKSTVSPRLRPLWEVPAGWRDQRETDGSSCLSYCQSFAAVAEEDETRAARAPTLEHAIEYDSRSEEAYAARACGDCFAARRLGSTTTMPFACNSAPPRYDAILWLRLSVAGPF